MTPRPSAPTRRHLQKGAELIHDGRTYLVLQLVDLDVVHAQDVETGEKTTLHLKAVSAANSVVPAESQQDAANADASAPYQNDPLSVTEFEWSMAKRWQEVLAPMLNQARPDKAYYAKAAQTLGVSTATIYRRLKEYKKSLQTTSFLDMPRPGGQGKSRIPEDVEKIITQCIETHYLSDQKWSPAAITKEVRRLCHLANLPGPAENTIRLRIGWVDIKRQVKERHGAMAAREFDPMKGSIPDADWPLAIVQVDHTLLPVIIVDDEHRLPIKRAWITLAIDCFSRVCLGMHVSLDAPSAMSAGLCISHAMLKKDRWLRQLKLEDAEWPFYGVMQVLHMDNAREFRGDTLKMACNEYAIDTHFRPVKRPNYGAHIERLMGTVTQRLKTVKGSTFSNVNEKGEYDSEANAEMTLDELERWLVLMFAAYHRDDHKGIGMSPIRKWKQGILGTDKIRGIGLPLVPTDEEKLRIDFMPVHLHGIYDYGVVLDGVHYFHDVLRPWMNQKDPKHPKTGRKFPFRRDPRDASQLYFFEPKLKRYYAIPYRDSSLPRVSVWELRAGRKAARQNGVDLANEREVFKFITRQREVEAESSAKTKAARIARQKLQQHDKAKAQQKDLLPKSSPITPTSTQAAIKGYDPSTVRPIDDDY